ncbi:hypothetical protein Tsubulata_015628 [Turnera subulata]|uniref:Thioredoxin domain-containing protein n=1 Tax=Turnera subulata TaxID=218843 RepID=A0A9Q0G960_9ROSI|nr:hypothetical protein Tsubulata_015628 [Turnera subulata]
MATVLESLSVPRSSPLLPRPPVTASASSSILSPRRSLQSPKVNGLKLNFAPSLTRFSGSVSQSYRLARFSRIVCEAQDTAVEVPAVTESTWKSSVLESEAPVLVEFWAPWCGPCRMIHPVIDELAKQYSGKLKCYKLNTDESGSIATQYGIRSIPTVMIFKDGEKKDAIIGAVPKTTLTTSIEKFL